LSGQKDYFWFQVFRQRSKFLVFNLSPCGGEFACWSDSGTSLKSLRHDAFDVIFA